MRVTIFLSVPRVRVASSKCAKTGRWSDKSFRIVPLKTLWARLLVNMFSISVAEYEVRRVGLEMRGRRACENELSINSCVGTWWLYWRRSRLEVSHHITMFIVFKISDFVLFRILKAISRLFLDSTSVSAKHSDSRMHFYQQYHYLQSAGKNSVIAKGKYNTHLMYGPEGNR